MMPVMALAMPVVMEMAMEMAAMESSGYGTR